jgi:hypothetical protein
MLNKLVIAENYDPPDARVGEISDVLLNRKGKVDA